MRAGYTLLEILVSMVIGTMVLMVAVGLLQYGGRVTHESSRCALSEMMGRNAEYVVACDLARLDLSLPMYYSHEGEGYYFSQESYAQVDDERERWAFFIREAGGEYDLGFVHYEWIDGEWFRGHLEPERCVEVLLQAERSVAEVMGELDQQIITKGLVCNGIEEIEVQLRSEELDFASVLMRDQELPERMMEAAVSTVQALERVQVQCQYVRRESSFRWQVDYSIRL